METSTVVIWVFGTLLSRELIVFAWQKLFPSKKDKTEATGAVAALDKSIDEMVKKRVDDAKAMLRLEQDNKTLEMKLEIKQGVIDDYKSDMQAFFKEQGASEQRERESRERERNCQKDLSIEKDERQKLEAKVASLEERLNAVKV